MKMMKMVILTVGGGLPTRELGSHSCPLPFLGCWWDWVFLYTLIQELETLQNMAILRPRGIGWRSLSTSQSGIGTPTPLTMIYPIGVLTTLLSLPTRATSTASSSDSSTPTPSLSSLPVAMSPIWGLCSQLIHDWIFLIWFGDEKLFGWFVFFLTFAAKLLVVQGKFRFFVFGVLVFLLFYDLLNWHMVVFAF